METTISGFIWAFLRRWYGGLFGKKQHPILSSRSLQTATMLLILFLAFYIRDNNWMIALGVALWVQFQFWSRAIGEVLDCGRSTIQNAASYDRWFRIPLDWIYDLICKQKYVGFYDWWYLWLRFTLPMIVPAIIYQSWSFILIGLASAPIYFGSYYLFEKFNNLYKLPQWIGQPKNLSEIVYGFIFGLGIML